MKPCACCGMLVEDGAYHPYGACLMMMAAKDSAVVQTNLDAIVRYGEDHVRGERKSLAILEADLVEKRKAVRKKIREREEDTRAAVERAILATVRVCDASLLTPEFVEKEVEEIVEEVMETAGPFWETPFG